MTLQELIIKTKKSRNFYKGNIAPIYDMYFEMINDLKSIPTDKKEFIITENTSIRISEMQSIFLATNSDTYHGFVGMKNEACNPIKTEQEYIEILKQLKEYNEKEKVV